MSINGPETQAWYDRACESLAYGVSSNFRYWGDETPVVKRGRGARVWDMDGREYIDYRNGYGPIILGHAHPGVNAAVAAAIDDGTTFALTQEKEVLAAEAVRKACPWLHRLRFTNSGTEATMHAIRIARAHTGRASVLKCEGQYHGMHDYVLWSTATSDGSYYGSRRDPIPVQASSGIPTQIRAVIATIPFNDLAGLERLFRARAAEIACFIVEPILGNAGGIMPAAGYLEGVRRLCTEYGVVLIFDEVKTGFRIALGGAVEYFGVTPDLATYAKAMGNGYPVAAYGGSEEFIGTLVPGEVATGGTYTGNGLSMAATIATLQALAGGEPYEILKQRGEALMAGISELLAKRGVPHVLPGVPAMFGILLGVDEAPDYRVVEKTDGDLFERLGMALIARGVHLEPDAREPLFLSAALTEEDVARTLAAFEESLTAVL